MKLLPLALACALVATPAFAHSDTAPRKGGQVVEVGETAFELVRAPSGVSLYVRDDGDEIPPASLTAKLIVTTGTTTTEVPLTVGESGQLFAKDLQVPHGARVGVLIVSNRNQARQSATFTIN